MPATAPLVQARDPVGERPTRAESSRLVLAEDPSGQDWSVDLEVERWMGVADAEEASLLDSLPGPVIDLGCGPGRLVTYLAGRAKPALGVDSSAVAVALARRRGAAVLERDLFDPLPGEGRWAAALLFDGNLGIGGNPRRLLARCHDLLMPGGLLSAEVAPPGTATRRVTAQVEAAGLRGTAFPWAQVSATDVGALARRGRLDLLRLDQMPSGRWFALCRRPEST
ncbi:MAG: class I SAM-dependent DNA methyltransferase [Acidimicrobiales bacterium]